MNSPNLFGDVAGHPPLTFRSGGGHARTVSGYVTTPAFGPDPFFLTPVPPSTLTNPLAPLGFQGATLGVRDFTSRGTFAAPTSGTLPLLENPGVTTAIGAQLARPGEVARFNPGSFADFNEPTGLPLGAAFLVYDFVFGAAVALPNPADGGVAGQRVAYDNNPLPRDRVLFTYDHLNNTSILPGLPTLNRYTVGVEKTFLDSLGSVELRLPVATTVDNSFSADAGAGNGYAAVGNLFAGVKVVGFASDSLLVSGGLGVSVPTAEGVWVRRADGSDLARVRNEAVFLTPYVAALWAPDDRLVTQGWVSVNLDTTGNPVLVSADGQGLRQVGRLRQEPVMWYDVQVSYWVFPQLAPFFEAHVGHGLGDGIGLRARRRRRRESGDGGDGAAARQPDGAGRRVAAGRPGGRPVQQLAGRGAGELVLRPDRPRAGDGVGRGRRRPGRHPTGAASREPIRAFITARSRKFTMPSPLKSIAALYGGRRRVVVR